MCLRTFNPPADSMKEQTVIMRQLMESRDSFTVLWDLAVVIKRAVQLLVDVLFQLASFWGAVIAAWPFFLYFS